MTRMIFSDVGTRNKGSFWEYISAYSFLNTKLPDTAFDLPLFLGIGEGIRNKHCHHGEVIERFRSEIFPKEFESGMYDDAFFKRFREVYLSDMRTLQELVKSVRYDGLSNGDLADLLFTSIRYISSTHKTMLFAFYAAYLDTYIERVFLDALSEDERGDAVWLQEQLAMLLTTPEPSFADKEQAAFFRIEQQYVDTHQVFSDQDFVAFVSLPEVDRSFKMLVSAFGWFHMEYMHLPLTEEEYIEQLRKRISLRMEQGGDPDAPEEAKRKIREQQSVFFVSHPRSKTLKQLIRVMHHMALVLDETKVEAVRGHFFITPLLYEIAKRLQCTRDDILLLPVPEITRRLYANESLSAEVAAMYRDKRAVLLRGGHITWYCGDSARHIEEQFLEQPSTKEMSDVKGLTVFPGKYQGKVTVIQSIRDKYKFTAGDVLVTHDGTAELTMFLQQAGAIVTDQGGIISHVAIVAREFKRPCIVGTKIATQVLHDGDVVEVDADHGVVRIVERAKPGEGE